MKHALAAALFMAASSLSVVPAGAASLPVLPAPFVFATASACTTSPCQNDFGQKAFADDVPLSQFGRNYTVTNVDENHNPTVFNTIQNTPGELTVGNMASGEFGVAIANGSPRVMASEANDTVVGSTQTVSELTYDFEIVPDLGQGARTPVTVGVTATGQISGSTTSPPSGFASINSAHVFAELVIPGEVNELAEAEYSYVCLLADGDCSQTTSQSTSNVAVKFGTTSTFSGGFHLANTPLQILTDVPYQVDLDTDVTLGDYPGSGTAFVDPMFSVPVGYTLVLSPGISNGVPEPATWAMMLCGFGGLGALARRRRAQAAQNAA